MRKKAEILPDRQHVQHPGIRGSPSGAPFIPRRKQHASSKAAEYSADNFLPLTGIHQKKHRRREIEKNRRRPTQRRKHAKHVSIIKRECTEKYTHLGVF